MYSENDFCFVQEGNGRTACIESTESQKMAESLMK